jgi:tungstate transport system substrate-binding protein
MDALVAAFDSTVSGISVRVLAVGSGEALALGRRGDADLLITHAPDQEAAFVEAGHGASPVVLMHNHFVIAGPAGDPAGVREAASAAEAFTRIARAGLPFLTRGDSSGTHVRELRVWNEAGIHPDFASAPWYIESGVGMGDLLRVAAERQAYTLSDRATFLMLGAQTGLEILFDDGSALLYNPYTATLVTAGRNQAAARKLHDWLQTTGQEVIARYGVEQYGRPLFVPGPGG